MFDFLCRYIPRRLAAVLTGLWYGGLLCAILLRLQVDQAPFRYWGL